LVVLPGGSPSRLRKALFDTGVGALLAERWQSGDCAIVGASAGAMLLCSHTVLPDRGGRPVVSGLGLLPRALVLPHWSGRSDWLASVRPQLPEGTRLLGLPERSGVIVEGDGWTAWGPRPSELVPADVLAVGETRQMS
jgi:cyanophycinase-like exopeptidase